MGPHSDKFLYLGPNYIFLVKIFMIVYQKRVQYSMHAIKYYSRIFNIMSRIVRDLEFIPNKLYIVSLDISAAIFILDKL